VDFEHRPNPLRLRGQKLNRRALRGLELFRDRCEYCHQASISTRAAESLPFDEWRAWLESAWNDLVWAAPFYSKTGIEPYVHRAGARVPSLRRAWQKYPYFTNGSSRTLRDVLARFRYRDVTAWHHLDPVSSGRAAGTVKSLTDEEIGSLLELLRFF
jgi:cytochrome c peroxidase